MKVMQSHLVLLLDNSVFDVTLRNEKGVRKVGISLDRFSKTFCFCSMDTRPTYLHKTFDLTQSQHQRTNL